MRMQSVGFTPTAATTAHVHAVRTRRVKGKYIYSEHLFNPALCKIVPMAALNVKNEQRVIKERGAFCIMAVDTESFFFCHILHFCPRNLVFLCFAHLSAQQMLIRAQWCRARTVNIVHRISESSLTTAQHCIYGFFLFFFQIEVQVPIFFSLSLFPAEHFEAVSLLLLLLLE